MKIVALAKTNDLIKDLNHMLKSNKTPNQTIVDDLFALSVVLKQYLIIEQFFFCNDFSYREEANDIKEKLIQKAKNVYSVSTKTMDSLIQKENAIKMIAVVNLPITNYGELKNKDFILVVDKIELPGNLGTIFRTMDAVGGDAIISVDPFTKLNNPKLVHASRGMNLAIPQLEDTYENVLGFLQKEGYTIYLGEPLLGQSYDKLDYSGKIAIIVGSERYGINPDWYNHPHEKVFIPMYGQMTSLNVGVAASILLYEAKLKKLAK